MGYVAVGNIVKVPHRSTIVLKDGTEKEVCNILLNYSDGGKSAEEGDYSNLLNLVLFDKRLIDVCMGLKRRTFLFVYGTIQSNTYYKYCLTHGKTINAIANVVLPVGELCQTIIDQRERKKYEKTMFELGMTAAEINYSGDPDGNYGKDVNF